MIVTRGYGAAQMIVIRGFGSTAPPVPPLPPSPPRLPVSKGGLWIWPEEEVWDDRLPLLRDDDESLVLV